MKKQSGITLIALVITIIVLLILAGITIAMIAGQDSAPAKAAQAKAENDKGAAKDAAALLVTDYMQKYYDGKYISNEAAAKNAADVGAYINAKLANPVTKGEYTFQVVSGEFRVSDPNGNSIVKGTINSNGTITWTGEATSSGNSTPAATTSAEATSATDHTGVALTMGWSKLSELADIISNTPSIGNTTVEVTVNDGTQDYTLGIGDYLNVYYDSDDGSGNYTEIYPINVRILGFNHDVLTNDTSKRAGISFECTDAYNQDEMNDDYMSTDGYGSTPLRTKLNTTYLEHIREEQDNNSTLMSEYIKPVNKLYNKGEDGTEIATCTGNYLWLLSYSEIWQEPSERYPTQNEGDTYALYVKLAIGDVWEGNTFKDGNAWLRTMYMDDYYVNYLYIAWQILDYTDPYYTQSIFFCFAI